MTLIRYNPLLFFLLVLLLLQTSYGQDCSLIVPKNPLTATGLATPYLLVSNDANNPCTQAGNGASFVQGAVIDLDTGVVSIYNPLVIDQGTTAATPPVLPTLPHNNIIGLWFGTNGDTLTLVDQQGSLSSGKCVNGIKDSIFGQFAYCNAVEFFIAANVAILEGKLTVPSLTTATDGYPCPTTRSFFIVDQDQSDNVVTSYLITSSGKIAQNTAANRAHFPDSTVLDNGSDEGLVVLVDEALGCIPWMANDLADPGSQLASLPMNELFAAYRQQAPIALVPAGDPMVLVNGNPNLEKINAYRVGVSQFPALSLSEASTTTYCRNIESVFTQRISDAITTRLLSAEPSPDDTSSNLYTFLVARWNASLINLNCAALL
jgi:hypothetical protein